MADGWRWVDAARTRLRTTRTPGGFSLGAIAFLAMIVATGLLFAIMPAQEHWDPARSEMVPASGAGRVIGIAMAALGLLGIAFLLKWETVVLDFAGRRVDVSRRAWFGLARRGEQIGLGEVSGVTLRRRQDVLTVIEGGSNLPTDRVALQLRDGRVIPLGISTREGEADPDVAMLRERLAAAGAMA